MQLTYPLLDLHRHLEGSIRLQTVAELAERFGLPLPRDTAQLGPLLRSGPREVDLLAFLAKIDAATSALVDLDACSRVAYEAVEDAGAEGIAYLELRFSPLYMSAPHGLASEGVIEAVADGVRRGARDVGVRTKLIGILVRNFGPEMALRELETLLAKRELFVGLDLAGDEAGFPGALFVEHFRRGREAGWRLTAHAGEAAGAAGVWQAVTELGVERIGHGVRAIEDPRALDLLAERRIGLEMNLTSNVQTSTVPDLASHPLRLFLERGLLATINTDDPAVSGITLPYELTVAAPAAGLSERQIGQAQGNALEIAFLSAEERATLLAEYAASRGSRLG